MALTLLALLIALGTAYALPDLRRLREFLWLRAVLRHWPGEEEHEPHEAWRILLLPLLIFLLCGLVQLALRHTLLGLPAFAFATAVLYYAWGPRDLDVDIQEVLDAPDGERRLAAAQALCPDLASEPLPLAAAPLVEASFGSALSRWFGVLFWFVLLGPAGALGYRVVQLLARHAAIGAGIASASRAWLERCARVLDWAPAHLMVLSLALVSEFDAVLDSWRGYHRAHGRGFFTLDLGFVAAVARASVDADVEAGDGYVAEVSDPLHELADARTVLRRVLLVWLALIALAGISGLAH